MGENSTSRSNLDGRVEKKPKSTFLENVETSRSNLDERVAPAEPIIFDTKGKRIPEPKFLSVGYLPDGKKKNQTPDSNGRKIVVFILVLLVIGYGLKKL